jgi:hypothetical protein
MQNPTVQIALDGGPQIGTIKPIGPLKTFLIDPFKGFEAILDTMEIGRILRPPLRPKALPPTGRDNAASALCKTIMRDSLG